MTIRELPRHRGTGSVGSARYLEAVLDACKKGNIASTYLPPHWIPCPKLIVNHEAQMNVQIGVRIPATGGYVAPNLISANQWERCITLHGQGRGNVSFPLKHSVVILIVKR